MACTLCLDWDQTQEKGSTGSKIILVLDKSMELYRVIPFFDGGESKTENWNRKSIQNTI